MTKRCRTCRETKDEAQFYNFKANDDGLHTVCKQCCKVSRSLEAVRRRDKKSKVSIRQWIRARGLQRESDKSITLAGLFKAHRGICALCETWVQPRYASIDHAHPLSKGGDHVWDNVQLAHLKCNLKKGASI